MTECGSDCPSTLSGTEVCPARWSFSARQTQSIQANRSSVILVSLVILRAVQGESLRTFGAKLIVCHRIGQATCRAVTADTKLALHRSYRGAISVQSQPSVHQAAAKAFIDPDLRLPSKQALHPLFCIMATLRLLSRLGRGRQAFALLLLLKTFIVASSEMILKKIDIIYPYLSDERDRSEISPVFRLSEHRL